MTSSSVALLALLALLVASCAAQSADDDTMVVVENMKSEEAIEEQNIADACEARGLAVMDCLSLKVDPCLAGCPLADVMSVTYRCELDPCTCAASFVAVETNLVLDCSEDLDAAVIAQGQSAGQAIRTDERLFYTFSVPVGVANFELSADVTGASFSKVSVYLRKDKFPDRLVFDWSSNGNQSSTFNWERDTIPKVARPAHGTWHVAVIGDDFEERVVAAEDSQDGDSSAPSVNFELRWGEAAYNAAPKPRFSLATAVVATLAAGIALAD